MKALIFVIASAMCISTQACFAEEAPEIADAFKGPYSGKVVRVIDGDTIVVRVVLWPNLFSDVAVRVKGIDAPEIKNTNCEAEKALGAEAKSFVEERYEGEMPILLEGIEPDAFFGRVVADIRRWRSDRWLPLSKELLDAGLAVEWTPGQNPVPWCLLAQPVEN